MKKNHRDTENTEQRPKTYKLSVTIAWMFCGARRVGHAVPQLSMPHWEYFETSRTALCSARYADGNYVWDDVPLCPICLKLVQENRDLAPAYTNPLPAGKPF